jgi:hypothetical protein
MGKEQPLHWLLAVKRQDVLSWYRPEDFSFDSNKATCVVGKTLTSNDSIYTHKSGTKVHYKARDEDCSSCPLKAGIAAHSARQRH